MTLGSNQPKKNIVEKSDGE